MPKSLIPASVAGIVTLALIQGRAWRFGRARRRCNALLAMALGTAATSD